MPELPVETNLQQLRHQAKDLLGAAGARDAEALARPITRAALSCRRVVPFVVDLATNRKDTRVSEESDRVIIVRLVELAYTKITDSGDNPQAWPAEAVDALAEAVESTGRLEDEHGEPAVLRLKEDLRAMGDHRAELLLAAMAFIGNDIAKEV